MAVDESSVASQVKSIAEGMCAAAVGKVAGTGNYHTLEHPAEIPSAEVAEEQGGMRQTHQQNPDPARSGSVQCRTKAEVTSSSGNLPFCPSGRLADFPFVQA